MATSSISRFSKLETDPLRNFRFLVNFTFSSGDATNNEPSAWRSFTGGFTQVTGLSTTIADIAYREGGMNTTLHRVPGQASFQPISLQRGVLYGKSEAINWMKQLFTAAAGEGIPGSGGKNFRCNVEIIVLDHPIVASPQLTASGAGDAYDPRAYKMKFIAHNAWISSLNFSGLSAADNNLMYEDMTLVHEGLSVSFVNN
jgi:phage tail-like protein